MCGLKIGLTSSSNLVEGNLCLVSIESDFSYH